MHPLVRQMVKKAKLAYLWLVRILGAPKHYDVPLHSKLWMNVRGGFLGDQFVIYDLAQNPPSDYLSEFDWYRSRWINEPFDPMLNNKIICTEVLKHVAYVPEVLFIKNKGRMICSAEPEELSSASRAFRTIDEAGAVFMKPIGAGKGTGVHRIDSVEPSQRYLLDGALVTRSEVQRLMAREDGWFLCQFVEQHPDVARLFPDASNTVRIITMRDPKTGRVKVFFAVLRLGTQVTVPVDNGSRGGLVSRIDLDTGTLSEARSLWSSEVHEVHPDSGVPIRGATVPLWDQVKQEALRLAELFPYLQFVAWDMLVTEKGPCVIEANTSSGVNIIQLWGPQRQGVLGDFYRAHGVIK